LILAVTGRLSMKYFPVCVILAAVFTGASLVGSVIGFILRGRIGLELFVCLICSVAYMLLIEWSAGPLGNVWSRQTLLSNFLEHVGGFLFLFFAPCFAAAIFVGARRERS